MCKIMSTLFNLHNNVHSLNNCVSCELKLYCNVGSQRLSQTCYVCGGDF